MTKRYGAYKGKTIYTCKVNGDLGGGETCRNIDWCENTCTVHANEKCVHKVRKES